MDDAEFSAAVKTHHQTSVACPMTYEGELEDGKHFVFNYRWGFASLGVGNNQLDARLDPQPAVLPIGHEADGWMGKKDFQSTFLRLLSKHQEAHTQKES